MRFPLRSFSTLVLAVGVATCSDSPHAVVKTAPEGQIGKGRFSIAPRFSPQAAAVYAQRATFAAVSFDHVRIVLTRPPSETVIDTVITFNPASPPTTLDLFVDVKTTSEIFDGAIQYTNNGAVVYQASGKIQSYPPNQVAPTPQELVAVYVGPGATAKRVAIAPKTSTIQAPGSVSFTATAFDDNNAPVPGAPIAWSVSDASIGILSATSGTSTSLSAVGKRGAVTVTATIPTNASDNATITVTLPPAAIVLVSGGGQTGKAGNALASPAIVRVNASDGVGVPGVSVQFAGPAGGSVGSASATTDAQGQATSSLTLGGTVGAQSFAASAAGFSVSIPASATPGDPALLAAVSGAGQTDSVGRPLKAPFVVKVSDKFGNGVGGVTVAWAKTSGGGTLGGTSSVTAADGTASISYTLGSSAGTETVTATAAGIAPVSFSATAVTGPASIVAVGGAGQSGRVGQPLTTPLVVKVVDASGAPVVGAIVSWTATNGTVSGGGSTDAQGQATATFTLGTTVGSATATATVGSGGSAKSVTFTATVQAGTVAKIVFRVSPTSVGVGAVIIPAVQIELQDAGGNRTSAVNAVSIAIGGNPSQATLGGTLTRNAVAGVATFDDLTLSAVGNGFTFVASSAGVPSITSAAFNVTGTASVPTIAFVDGQTLAPLPAQPPPSVTMTAGVAPANPPSIRVVDAQGAPIANAAVSYTVTRGAQTLFSGTPQTNTQGIITFATLAISPNNMQVAGNYSFVATLNGATGSPLTLPVTVVPAAPSRYVVTTSTGTPAASAQATITAQLVDQFNNTIASANRTVSWTLSGAGGGSLGGATSQTNANGQATIVYTAAASPNGSTVTATATDVTTPSVSGQVTLTPQVAAPTPTRLGILSQPSASTTTGTTLAQQPSVQIQDASGNPVATPTPVTVTATWSAGTVQNATATTNTSGVATFTNLTLVGTGTAPIVFAATGLTSATSINVTSTIQLAAQAVEFQVHPGSTTQGSTIAPAVQVRIVDGNGTTVTPATNTVTLAIGTNPSNGTLSGTVTAAAVNGVATFSNLSINNAGIGYTLQATSTGLTPATSNTFTILATGATRTWTGTASSTWTDPANWSGGVPGAADDAIIPAGTLNAPSLPTTTIRSLTIAPSAVANVTSVTFTTTAGLTNQGTLNIAQSTIAGPINNQGLVFAVGSSAFTGAVTTTTGSILRMQGQPNNGTGALTVSNGFTNLGTIELTDITAGYGASFNVLAGTLVNGASGIISVLQGANGPRGLSAQLDNQGTLTLSNTQGLTLAKASAAHTNSGTININAGNLTVTQSGTTPSFSNTGTINVAASRFLSVTGGTLNLSAGLVAGAGTVFTNGATISLTPTTVTTFVNLTNNSVVAGGTFTIANGEQLNLVGGVFNAPITNNGTLFIQDVVTLSGALTTGTGSSITIQGNQAYGAASLTVANGFTNTATIQLTDITAGYGASFGVTTGTFTQSATGTFSVLQGANGPRTLAAQLDNQGTLTLSNTQGLTLTKASAAHTNSGTINITSGNLTVTQTGTTPSFTNTGTINVAASRFLSVTGGTLNLSTGLVSGAGTVFTNAATISLTPTTVTTFVNLTNNTTVAGGTFTIANGEQLNLVGGAFSAPLTNNGTLFIQDVVTLNGALTTGTGSTITIQGNQAYGAASLTVANGFTNTATIQLTDITAGYGASFGVTTGTFTQSATGTFSVLQGANGPRTLAAQLDNQGTLTLANTQGLALAKASAAHTSSGTININSGNLTVTQTGTTPSFTNTGTVNVAGSRFLSVTGGTLNLSAGLVAGAGTVFTNAATISLTPTTVTTFVNLTNNSTVAGGTFTIANGEQLNLVGGAFSAPLTNNGTLFIQDAVTLNGALTTGTGSTITIQGNQAYGAASLTVANGFTNTATIQLTDITAGYGASLGVTTGTLTQSATGTLSVLQGANGPRTLAAQLNNQGTLTLSNTQGLTLAKASAAHTSSGTININSGNLTVTQTGTAPSFTNTGTINVAGSRFLSVTGGTLDLAQGVVAGAGTVFTNAATISFTPTTVTTFVNLTNNTTVAGGTFTVPNGQQLNLVGGAFSAPLTNNGTLFIQDAVTLNGALTTGTGSTITIQGNQAYGAASLTVANGFTNTATIQLTDITAGYGASLGVTTGTLTQSATGTLSVLQGANGPRTLAAQLNNQGTLTLANTQGLTLAKASAAHTNSGTININSGNLTVTQTATSPSFTNTGTINVAGSRFLSVTGGTLDLAQGLVAGAGTVFTNAATISFTPATVTTFVNLTNNTTVAGGTFTIANGQTLNLVGGVFSAPLTNNGTLFVQDVATLNGALTTGTGSTITIQGNQTYGAASLTVANGFTNTATIELTDITAGYGASFGVTTGTFTQSPTGTFSVLQGANGPRTLAAQLDNQGTLTLSNTQGLTLAKASAAHTSSGTINITSGNLTVTQTSTSPSFTNTGTINVAASRFLSVTGGALNLSAGLVTGAGTVFTNAAAISFTPTTVTTFVNLTNNTTVGGGTFTIASGQTLKLVGGVFSAPIDNQGTLYIQDQATLNGALTTVSPSTILIEGNSVYGTASLTVANGFTNNGTMQMTDVSAGYGSTLVVSNGTFTNGVSGLVSLLPGAGGQRTVTAQIDNQGTMNVLGSGGMLINKVSAQHINSGTFTISGGNLTLTQSGTSPSFTNRGLLTVGPSRTLSSTAGTFINSGLPVGTIANSGTLSFGAGTFTNTGVLNPGGTGTAALSTVSGNLIQSGANAVLNFELGGTTLAQYDRLSVSGAMTFGGTLNVTTIGGFTPGPGSSFTIMGFTSTTGAFTTVNLPAGCSGNANATQYVVSCP
jgi:hypothetical protein